MGEKLIGFEILTKDLLNEWFSPGPTEQGFKLYDDNLEEI